MGKKKRIVPHKLPFGETFVITNKFRKEEEYLIPHVGVCLYHNRKTAGSFSTISKESWEGLPENWEEA